MLEKLKTSLAEAFPGIELNLSVNERSIVTVSGECDAWDTVVDVGHFLAKQEGVKNVVNKMTVKGLVIPKKDYAPFAKKGKEKGVIRKADVVIVGAGVCGCGIARELAKYELDIVVTDMADDVCTGASKANNGNIHPGMSVKPGTLKAKLNIEGNRMYQKWADELGFALDWCGCIGIVTDERLMPAAQMVFQVAQINGVHEPEMIDAERALELEPNLAKRNLNIIGGAYFPSFGQVESYEVVTALAENAAENGVE
ncbi:MAG: FAD-dependent oxidoreductase, partial [Lachnospiraceae bacterium]|nr:FAD-dependent oxidoreductase [Lachnospiraceae bacterium]